MKAWRFNNWFLNEWLADYTIGNFFVFDFHNVLTDNGEEPNTNDLDFETSDHHHL